MGRDARRENHTRAKLSCPFGQPREKAWEQMVANPELLCILSGYRK